MKIISASFYLRKVFRRDSLLRRAVAALVVFSFALNGFANPTGMTVQCGSATLHVNGSQLTVTAGNNAQLNWQSFNIAAGETTTFNQPSASSIVWNRINNNQGASQIYGSLQANGVVVLLNSSGFYFGPNSFVSAAGLVVSTANYMPPQNSGGGWEFNGPPPLASIVNFGTIRIGQNGSAFLIADKVENHGTIEAPGGSIGLAAGQTVTLSERPDGRGMSMDVVLPQGSVDNSGNLIADGGTISLRAKVVNQNGFIQANSVRDQNGVIELVASDTLNLGADSKILAQGDDSAAGSAGGDVTLQSGNVFSDAAGSKVITAGGIHGGNGGNVEVSAPNIQSLNTAMDASAQNGFTGGAFLLDPVNIILGTTGSGVPDNSGGVAYNSGSGTLTLNVNTAFANKNFSNIKLQATGNITLNAGTTWDLSASTGQSSGVVSLQAGGNITLGANSFITDANNWSLNLMAGVSFPAGTVTSGAGNIFLNGTIQTAGGSVNLQAGLAIQAGSGAVAATGDGDLTATTLAGSITTGTMQTFGGALTLTAGKDILADGGNLDASSGGSIFATATTGSITLGSASIQTDSGGINLLAAQDITVGSGSVTTSGGGSIVAHALTGNIDTGSDAQGYHFNNNAKSLAAAYDLSGGLGGISTAAGGDVTLIAGGDVTSVLPGKSSYYYDGNQVTPDNGNDYTTAGSGTYGPQAGNLTIVAGGNVTGHYLVANGTGSIYAGVQMDATGNPIKDLSGNYVLGNTGSAGTDPLTPNFALSLIKGGWNVTAAQNIILQEVRNPNGDFDIKGGAAYNHYFDYAPNDFVNLTAGNQVQLGAATGLLPRVDTLKVPFIYPSILNISAGAGGVVLTGDLFYNQLILFPSPVGSLTINTTDGGSLVSTLPASQGAPQIFNLIVSDSGSSQYTSSQSFGLNDHATTPVHLNSETPITLNIDGDMDQVLLAAPEAAQINVGGDMNNSRFQGMNLKSSDVTSISVKGDINNRGAFTSVDLSALSLLPGWLAPDFSVLVRALSSDPSATTLATSFYYNPVTKILTYQNIPGKTLASVLSLLENLTIQKVDKFGNLLWLDADQTVPATETVSVMTPAAASALLQEYALEGGVAPSGSYGYTIGGGGQFDISARNMDLGTTAGIQSKGVSLYQVNGVYPLASLFNSGADINVNLTGDLNMFSTSIASINGGNVSITAGGTVNVGSAEFSVASQGARGIFTSAQGDVSVIANGNININGSRIAGYDGGNVTVESLNGDVNAGTGGDGYVVLNAFYVDPVTHQVYADNPTIPGSGILATTFPARNASYPAPDRALGNILVETPNGSINAAGGGIVQLVLNNTKNSDSVIETLAGYELRDDQGNPVTAANIASGTPVQVSADRGIDATGSGVIGQNVVLKATGIIKGVIYSANKITLDAGQIGPTVALGKTIDATGPAVGPVTLIGTTGVSYSGSGDPTILSSDANGGGSSFAQGTTADAASAAASNQAADTETQTAANTDATEDDLKKKKGIGLMQKVSRVTVILPPKSLSEKPQSNNSL